MKRESVDVIQLALPVSGANDTQVLNNLCQEVASLQEAWTGQAPKCHPDGTGGVDRDLTSIVEPACRLAYEHGLVPLGLDLGYS